MFLPSLQATKYNLLLHRNKVKFCVYVFLLVYVCYTHYDMFRNPQCIIEMPNIATEIFREPEHCGFCENTTFIEKLDNITPRDFFEKYTKTGTPVVVTDGIKNWQASTVFSFDFLKKLYQAVEHRKPKKTCQFFPYKTEFRGLDEVFAMSRARASLSPGEKPWYVGWSNCNDEAGKKLRKYYSKPYFLGNNSENIAMMWIFMGGPGRGAHMHIDNVHYPSWQAQLSGKKLWKFAPPPECYNICNSMSIMVEPGEIIVADTNRWYHQTVIMEGDLSITIGSEFD